MSQIVPWTTPGGAPCCCERTCEHTANFSDPTLWDPLISATQIEITQEQYALFTAGGTMTLEASASDTVIGSVNIPPGDLVLNGVFSWSASRIVQSVFLNNSCKQSSPQWQETAFTKSCSSSGNSTGTNSEFFPYMALDYPCNPTVATTAAFSFYNAAGTTPGRLYNYGMYFRLLVNFGADRNLSFGEEGFQTFLLTLSSQYRVTNNLSDSELTVPLVTSAGTIQLPVQSPFSSATSSGSVSLSFNASAP